MIHTSATSPRVIFNTSVVENPAMETINERVGQVYLHTAFALGITSCSARIFAKARYAPIVFSALVNSPLISVAALTAIGVGLLMAAGCSPKENSLARYGFYGLFTVFQGLVLSPLVLIDSAAFTAATLSTVALTGGLGVLAMNVKTSFEKYEKILKICLGALALISLSSLLLPASAAAIASKISYLGGFALFSCYIIHDTHKARTEANSPAFDPLNHSINIYLNAVSLLIRIWEAFQRSKSKN